MRTIGVLLKEARGKKRYSLDYLAQLTKIKKDFIERIENEDWASLPDFTVVTGFVKSVSKSLDLEERNTVALLRRDYPRSKEIRLRFLGVTIHLRLYILILNQMYRTNLYGLPDSLFWLGQL